jgi:phytoene synthase
MAGLIRLEWWRDAILGLYQGKVGQHMILADLFQVIEQFNLPPELFCRMIDAREQDVEQHTPLDLIAIEKYAHGSCSSLLELALRIICSPDKKLLTLVDHLGIAWAVLGHIRSLKYTPLSAQLILPQILLEQHKLSVEQVYDTSSTLALSKMIELLVEMAEDHLSYVFISKKHIPSAALPVFLLANMAESFIKRIRACNYNVLQHDLEKHRIKLQMQLLFKSLCGGI